MTGHGWRRFHVMAMGFWVVLAIPAVMWWKESVLFVILLSLYANFGTHFASWQASRMEEKTEEAS